MQGKKILPVVAALIQGNGKVLIAQRYSHDSYGDLWEFPGGKIERGETAEQALAREIQEELGVEITVGNRVGSYEDESDVLKIQVYLYDCTIVRGEPQAVECAQIRWISPEAFAQIDFAPADKKAVEFVRKYIPKEKN